MVAPRAAGIVATAVALLSTAASRAQDRPEQDPAPAAPAPPSARTLHQLRQDLAAAVDLPTPGARAAAAAALAGRGDVDLDSWLLVCRSFAPRDPLPAGAHVLQLDLPVQGAIEPTEVHVYVPPAGPPDGAGDRPRGPAPLLLWGHGAGGDGAGQHQLWRAVADRLGMVVVAPTEAGDAGGWGFTARERAAQLAALRAVRRRVDVDEDRVYVGGVSRGGHMAWDLLLRHPDLFAAALPCIGGPRLQIGAQCNLRYLENAVHVPIRDLQGSQDDPLLLANLRLCFARLAAAGGADQELIEFEDRGHGFDLAAVDWAEFLQVRRDPERARVVRMAARADEARSAWLEITGFGKSVEEEFTLRVGQRRWERLDEDGQRELVLDEALRRTARAVATRTEPGRFTLDVRGAVHARLWLSEALLGDATEIVAKWGNRTVRRPVERSAAVLLADFVERFDRRFLPVAAATVGQR
ncbi:MAG: PHB depolymerase family esterase [Planctomycetota bacterium]